MGRFNDIYVQMTNPLENDALLRRLIEDYCNHDSIIETVCSYYANQRQNHHGAFYQHFKDNLYVQLYQLWKNNILSLTDEEIDEIIKNNPNISKDFRLLKEYIRNIDIRSYEEYKEVIKDPRNLIAKYGWHNTGQLSGWCHIKSSMLNLGKEPIMNYKHKLALNVESIDLDYLASLFIGKCVNKQLPFYIKLDEYGKRDDALVIYSDTEHLQDYINILEELKHENPTLFERVCHPPVLMGQIDNVIGYASESLISPEGSRISFEKERTSAIEKGIVESIKTWILQNQFAIISYNGQELSFKEYLVTNITNAIMRENENAINELINNNGVDNSNQYSSILSSVESLRDKIYTTLLEHIDEVILNYCQGKPLIPIKVPLEYNYIVIKNSYFYHAFDQLGLQIIQNSPNFVQNVKQHIMDESYKLGIDPDKYCFNIEARKELFNYQAPNKSEQNKHSPSKDILGQKKELLSSSAELEKSSSLLSAYAPIQRSTESELSTSSKVEQSTLPSSPSYVEIEKTLSESTTINSQDQENNFQSFIDWIYKNLYSLVSYHDESIKLYEYLSILITDNLISRYKNSIPSLRNAQQLKDMKDYSVLNKSNKSDTFTLKYVYGYIRTKLIKILKAVYNKTSLSAFKVKFSDNLYLELAEADINKSLLELLKNINDISSVYNENSNLENDSLDVASTPITLPIKVDMDTILSSLEPTLLEQSLLLPNGDKMPTKEYIQKYVLPIIPADGYFILDGNVRIPYKEYIKYYVLTIGQTIFKGDIDELLKYTTNIKDSLTMKPNVESHRSLA